MMPFRFAHIDMLYGIIFALIFILFLFFLEKRSQKQMKKLFKNQYLFLTSHVCFFNRYLKLFLNFLILTFLIICLARPQLGMKKESVDIEGVELMVLFDVSRSMWTQDVRPNRLQYSKRQLLRFFHSLGFHKIGLIAFAGSAFLISPFTSDKSALAMYVDSLDPTMMSYQGTNFSKALQIAQKSFQRSRQKQPNVFQAIVIISDGEDDDSGALSLASDFKKQSIPIFSVGIGTSEGGLIPKKNSLGYHKDLQGKVVRTQLNEKLLQNLSQLSGGQFFSPVSNVKQWQDLVLAIENLRKTKMGSYFKNQYKELFHWPLIIALLLFLIDLMLSDSKKLKQLRSRWKVFLP